MGTTPTINSIFFYNKNKIILKLTYKQSAFVKKNSCEYKFQYFIIKVYYNTININFSSFNNNKYNMYIDFLATQLT